MKFEELRTAVQVMDHTIDLAAALSELENHESTDLYRLVVRELDLKIDAMHVTTDQYTVAERLLMTIKEFVMDVQDMHDRGTGI